MDSDIDYHEQLIRHVKNIQRRTCLPRVWNAPETVPHSFKKNSLAEIKSDIAGISTTSTIQMDKLRRLMHE